MNIQFQSSSSRSCKSNQPVQAIMRLFSFTVKQVNSPTFVSIINYTVPQLYITQFKSTVTKSKVTKIQSNIICYNYK